MTWIRTLPIWKIVGWRTAGRFMGAPAMAGVVEGLRSFHGVGRPPLPGCRTAGAGFRNLEGAHG